jgi:polyphosphate kinase 2 (PPK2 family)
MIPEKNWKFNEADIQERDLWREYMTAYEECLSATSTRHAPWYIVPADDKENERLDRVIRPSSMRFADWTCVTPSRAQAASSS